jgi:hypothetical protein
LHIIITGLVGAKRLYSCEGREGREGNEGREGGKDGGEKEGERGKGTVTDTRGKGGIRYKTEMQGWRRMVSEYIPTTLG